jgi:hypothetical protein
VGLNKKIHQNVRGPYFRAVHNPVTQPGQAGTKKENMPPRHKDTKGFFYKKFFFVFLGVLVPLWPFFLFFARKWQDFTAR